MYINILVAQYHNTSTGNWILKSGKLVGKMASIVHLQPRKLIFLSKLKLSSSLFVC